MCLYSHAVDTGHAGRAADDQQDAERFARALLMPDEALVPVIGWSDAALAELFIAPLDEVERRRRDIGGDP